MDVPDVKAMMTAPKIYARQRFASSKFINEERMVEAIEMTRFPVPNDPAYQVTNTEPAG
jgi:hypothetical protein